MIVVDDDTIVDHLDHLGLESNRYLVASNRNASVVSMNFGVVGAVVVAVVLSDRMDLGLVSFADDVDVGEGDVVGVAADFGDFAGDVAVVDGAVDADFVRAVADAVDVVKMVAADALETYDLRLD